MRVRKTTTGPGLPDFPSAGPDGSDSRAARPATGSCRVRLNELAVGFLSLPIVIIVLLLDGLYLLESLVLRTLMLARAGELTSFIAPFKAAKYDILWMTLLSAAFIIAGSAAGRVLKKFVIGLYVLLMAVSFLALFIHFAVFTVTGTGLTADYILHWFANTADVNRMIGKEIRLRTLIPVVLQIALIIFILISPRLILGSGRRAVEPARKLRGWLSALLVAGATGALIPPLGVEVNDALGAVPTAQVLETLVPRNDETALPADIPPAQRMDAEITLEPQPGSRLPNVVLIIFESLGWKHSDVYTPGLGATPFLKELASRALVVEELYSVVPHTTKALVPILGGFYPYLGMDADEALPGILPRRGLAWLLRRHGYRTAFFQTADNYEDRAQLAANLGFETFRGLENLPAEGFADVNYFGKEERMMLKPSLDWAEAERGRPFFLTYLTLSTHHNYGTPPGYPEKYYGGSDPALNRYLNAVRFTDDFIRELFAEFEKRGLDRDTVFIVIGDHGEAFGEHGLRGHNFTLWEEGMRVLGLVFVPGAGKTSGVIKGLRSTLDIAPTVCELAGLRAVRGGFIGSSLLQPAPEGRKLFFSGWSKNRVLALREADMKYIAWPALGRFEAYRPDSDPYDRHNLARSGRVSPKTLEAKLEEMERWAGFVNAHYAEWRRSAAAAAAAASSGGPGGE